MRESAAARSPAARSAPALAAISGAIAAMRSSDWPRPAPNTGSHSGTIWAIGSVSQVTRSFRLCRNSFAVAAGLAESRGLPRVLPVLLFSLLSLTILAIPLMLIALAIKLDSPGPVLFRQRRTGLHGEEFEILKFRTMHHELADPWARQQTRREDPRVTRTGALLRRTSLDE